MIRPACITDVPAMARIVNDCAEYGLMLHRSLSELYENLRDFFVAVDEQDQVIGVCGLDIIWADLAEVYALAVSPKARGKGVGRLLVQACVDEARRLGIRRLMSLTYEQAFFQKLGFAIVDRQKLPMKVWTQCVRCPKNQACDEIAMVRVLEDVPAIPVPNPSAPPTTVMPLPVLDQDQA